MIRRRVAIRAAALAAIASLAIAACGGGGDDTGGGSDVQGGAVQGPAPASGPPEHGGTLRIQVGLEPANLDPATMQNSYAVSGAYGNALYGQLLTTDPETGEIRPGFAESLTTADNTLYTLRLRDGISFTDGTPLDAEAVKVSWERLKDPKISLALNVSAAAPVDEMRVVDPLTLEFTLGQPSAHFGQNIVISALNWIVSPTALAAGDQAFGERPVGAGPFMLDEWRRGDRLLLVRNPDYFEKPLPYLDAVEIRVDTDANRRLQSVQTGGADFIINTSAEHTAKAAELGLVATTPLLNGMSILMFNMAKPPFDDLRARQALFAAIDLKLALDSAYNGYGEIPTTLFREGTPFYSPDLTFPATDRERAQALFDELAAEGKPVDFVMLITQAVDSNKLAQSIQAQLETFDNVNMEIETADSATWFTRMGAGDFGATTYGWITVDPEPSLSRFMTSTSAGNLMKLNDPELDEALAIGKASTDLQTRKEAYRTVQERLIATLPFLPYNRTHASLITTPKVGGIETYGGGSPRIDMLWLDQD
ncbi:MAG: ABC transporter substrate-binding protein [Frankia sp.]|nr:ABC transporter substrate-binding protein [Frankia sp.]